MKKYLLIGVFAAFMLWAISGNAKGIPQSAAVGNVDAGADGGFYINGDYVE